MYLDIHYVTHVKFDVPKKIKATYNLERMKWLLLGRLTHVPTATTATTMIIITVPSLARDRSWLNRGPSYQLFVYLAPSC